VYHEAMQSGRGMASARDDASPSASRLAGANA